jgi:hypothetical protein
MALATIVLTSIVVVLNAVYIFTNRAVVVMRRQLEASLRPQITIRSFFDARRMLQMVIENTGKSPATDLKLELDKNFYAFETPESNIAKQNAFTRSIQCFPAGAQLFLELAPGCKSFDTEASDSKTPPCFNVSASYSYGGVTYNETTTVDLRQYAGSCYPPQAPGVHELAGICKALEDIKGMHSQLLLRH